VGGFPLHFCNCFSVAYIFISLIVIISTKGKSNNKERHAYVKKALLFFLFIKQHQDLIIKGNNYDHDHDDGNDKYGVGNENENANEHRTGNSNGFSCGCGFGKHKCNIVKMNLTKITRA